MWHMKTSDTKVYNQKFVKFGTSSSKQKTGSTTTKVAFIDTAASVWDEESERGSDDTLSRQRQRAAHYSFTAGYKNLLIQTLHHTRPYHACICKLPHFSEL